MKSFIFFLRFQDPSLVWPNAVCSKADTTVKSITILWALDQNKYVTSFSFLSGETFYGIEDTLLSNASWCSPQQTNVVRDGSVEHQTLLRWGSWTPSHLFICTAIALPQFQGRSWGGTKSRPSAIWSQPSPPPSPSRREPGWRIPQWTKLFPLHQRNSHWEGQTEWMHLRKAANLLR